MAIVTVKVNDTRQFQKTKDSANYIKKRTALRYDLNYLPNLLSLAKNHDVHPLFLIYCLKEL
jgi:hypothetical protein